MHESTRADIRAIAEGHISLPEQMDRGFNGRRALIVETARPVTEALQQHRRVLDDHEQRLRAHGI